MSDDGLSDYFRALQDAGRARRAHNRMTSPDVLRDNGVSFTEHNGGAHLIVSHAGRVADLWPGTGKYRVRGDKAYKRGVFNLLRDLGVGG